MIESIFTVLVICVMLFVVWQSSLMISEKKERQRKGLTDYYDNPIKKNKCMGGEE